TARLDFHRDRRDRRLYDRDKRYLSDRHPGSETLRRQRYRQTDLGRGGEQAQMITVRRSSERGVTKTDWLDSRHTFSFAEYDNPAFENFGALRVINEDRVAGGGGFPPHRHRDMEIVTYILEGALEHKDSTGGGGIIRPGEIQRMSAGAGITHAEFNASRDQPCHFMQIWIMPSKQDLTPSYEQKAIDAKATANKLARIASSEPQPNEVRLVQDAEIWAAKLD